jgi:4-carboxymuconolactone decarboxylase
MSERPAVPRMLPIALDDLTPEATELLAGMSTKDAIPNLYLTLVNYEGLMRRWLPFGAKVLNGKIPLRDRELLILRTGWNCQARYEWAQHAVIAQRIGLSEDEIQRVKQGSDAGWDDFEAALIRSADELHFDACVSDATWSTLASRYDKRQLIELLMLVGEYHLVAYAANSLGIALDEDVADTLNI